MEEITYNETKGVFFTKEEFQKLQKKILDQRGLISAIKEGKQ